MQKKTKLKIFLVFAQIPKYGKIRLTLCPRQVFFTKNFYKKIDEKLQTGVRQLIESKDIDSLEKNYGKKGSKLEFQLGLTNSGEMESVTVVVGEDFCLSWSEFQNIGECDFILTKN